MKVFKNFSVVVVSLLGSLNAASSGISSLPFSLHAESIRSQRVDDMIKDPRHLSFLSPEDFSRFHDNLSNTASQKEKEGDLVLAYGMYTLAAELDFQDTNARVKLAEILLEGIEGHLKVSDLTKSQAAEYLIDAALIELKIKPDEPDIAGRMLRAYSEDSYNLLLKESPDKEAAKAVFLSAVK
jgi:hypothetical protein